MSPGKWARVKTRGAHGLRRGAWYPVVNDSKPSIVVLDVNKKNVPVDRAGLEFSESEPGIWSVVRRNPTDPAARRASDAHLGPIYAVCPRCRCRTNVNPDDAEMICPACQSTFPIDWSGPC